MATHAPSRSLDTAPKPTPQGVLPAGPDDPSGLGYFAPLPTGPCAAPKGLGALDLHFGYYTPE